MPIVVQNPGTDIFWNTEDILNFARVLANDAQGSLAGQDLADARPYTWTLLNLCYAKLANWLEDDNVESATYDQWDLTLPISAGSSDPAAECRLGYDGFVDSNGFLYETPTLPALMLQPLNVSQRFTGQNWDYQDIPQRLGPLNGSYYGYLYRRWQFRKNSIYFTGNTSAQVDIRIYGIPSFPYLQPPVNGQPPQQIPFARAGEALAYMVAAEYLEIRGAANAPMVRAKANEQLQIISNKSSKRDNQAQTRKKGYGFNRRRRSW
jgi:hypothetical protein